MTMLLINGFQRRQGVKVTVCLNRQGVLFGCVVVCVVVCVRGLLMYVCLDSV